MNKRLSGKSYNGGTQVKLGWLSLDRVVRKSHADKVTFEPGSKDEKELPKPRGQGRLIERNSKCQRVSLVCARRGVSSLSLKEQIVNISGHSVSVTTSHLCCCSVKAAIDST